MKSYKLSQELLAETQAKDKILSIRLSQNEYSELENISKANDLTKNEVIRLGIKNLLK